MKMVGWQYERGLGPKSSNCQNNYWLFEWGENCSAEAEADPAECPPTVIRLMSPPKEGRSWKDGILKYHQAFYWLWVYAPRFEQGHSDRIVSFATTIDCYFPTSRANRRASVWSHSPKLPGAEESPSERKPGEFLVNLISAIEKSHRTVPIDSWS